MSSIRRGYTKNKTIVFGMVERDGDVMTKVVPNVKRKTQRFSQSLKKT